MAAEGNTTLKSKWCQDINSSVVICLLLSTTKVPQLFLYNKSIWKFCWFIALFYKGKRFVCLQNTLICEQYYWAGYIFCMGGLLLDFFTGGGLFFIVGVWLESEIFLLDFRELDFRELTKKCHKKAVPFGYENNGGQNRDRWTTGDCHNVDYV